LLSRIITSLNRAKRGRPASLNFVIIVAFVLFV
jgi:hypothetical protein